MAALRLGVILLLTSLLSGQEPTAPKIGVSNTPKPKLPVVDDMACPGKGNTVANVEISEGYRMYRSWQGNGGSIGKLGKGEKVTILGGVNIIREPDTAVIKYVDPDFPSSLKVEDVAFGYGIEADANDVFWARGECGSSNGTKGWRKAAIVDSTFLVKADSLSMSSSMAEASGGCMSRPSADPRVGC
jgi:hypothetical protein